MIGCVYNSEFLCKKKNKAIKVRLLQAAVQDLRSSSHFITSEQIVNWLQGITVSSGLTQTVNPRLWLAVMEPARSVLPHPARSVSTGGVARPKMRNANELSPALTEKRPQLVSSRNQKTLKWVLRAADSSVCFHLSSI